MSKFLTVMLCAIILASPCFSAGNKLFLQTQVKGTSTDNAFLSPTKTSDFITTAAMWIRQPVQSTQDSTLRLKADLKTYSWADHSFDSYTYSIIGADYKKSLGMNRNLKLAYGYITNDSYDFDTPFHLYKGHELSATYEFPVAQKSSVELGCVLGTRDWDEAASGRNGTGQEIRSSFTTKIREGDEASFIARWRNENTDDPTEEFTRSTIGISLTHYSKTKALGPKVSFDYRYSFRNYSATTREDVKNSFYLEADCPVGRDSDLTLGYSSGNNNSTFASRNYKEHSYLLSLLRKF